MLTKSSFASDQELPVDFVYQFPSNIIRRCDCFPPFQPRGVSPTFPSDSLLSFRSCNATEEVFSDLLGPPNPKYLSGWRALRIHTTSYQLVCILVSEILPINYTVSPGTEYAYYAYCTHIMHTLGVLKQIPCVSRLILHHVMYAYYARIIHRVAMHTSRGKYPCTNNTPSLVLLLSRMHNMHVTMHTVPACTITSTTSSSMHTSQYPQ